MILSTNLRLSSGGSRRWGLQHSFGWCLTYTLYPSTIAPAHSSTSSVALLCIKIFKYHGSPYNNAIEWIEVIVHVLLRLLLFTLTCIQAGAISMCVLGSLQGHISSVRSLAALASSAPDHHTLLFSGGGRASLRAWLIDTAGLAGEDSGKCRLSVGIHFTFLLFSSSSSWNISCLTPVWLLSSSCVIFEKEEK